MGLDEETLSLSGVAAGPEYPPTSGENFTFCDFLPKLLTREELTGRPGYETFTDLVERANIWLADQIQWEVQSLESVEFMDIGLRVNTEKMTSSENTDLDEYCNMYVRGLRLWLIPRADPEQKPQTLGLLTLIPQLSGDVELSLLESLDVLLERFNGQLHENPIPGRVLNVESQEIGVPTVHLFNKATFDPQRSIWFERFHKVKHVIFVIYIFYEQGEPEVEKLVVKDFIPAVITEGGLLSKPKYEPYSHVVMAASKWCAQQPNLHFCCAQSIEVKVKSGIVDSQRMSYTERSTPTSSFVRILRLAYVKLASEKANNLPQDVPPFHLTCKTFVPLRLTEGFFIPEFETLSKTRERIEDWINTTGAKVLSAETPTMRLYTGVEPTSRAETAFTHNTLKRAEYWLSIVRLYLDGVYEEPPSEALPMEPILEGSHSCTVT